MRSQAQRLETDLVRVRMVTRGIIWVRNMGGYDQANNTFGPLNHAVASAYQYEFQDLLQARGLHGPSAAAPVQTWNPKR